MTLYEAACEGRADQVKLLLRKDVTVDQRRGPLDATPLMGAAWYGHVDIIIILLYNGAQVDARDKDAATALLYAAQEGHVSIARILLQKNADVNAQNSTGMSALMLSAFNGHVEVVKILLQHGADVHAQHQNGTTAVMNSSSRGHDEITDLLFDHGAEVPSDIPMLLSTAYRSHKEEGRVYFAACRYNDALESYTVALSVCPDEDTLKAVLHKNMAACLLRLGRHQEASVSCSRCLEVAPGDVKALYRRCQAYTDLGKLTEAYTDAKDALRIDPGNASVKHICCEIEQMMEQCQNPQTQIGNLPGDQTGNVPDVQASNALHDQAGDTAGDQPGNTQSDRSGNEATNECKVCMEELVETCFQPCGHAVCCTVCADLLLECPVCRVKVKARIRMFLS